MKSRERVLVGMAGWEGVDTDAGMCCSFLIAVCAVLCMRVCGDCRSRYVRLRGCKSSVYEGRDGRHDERCGYSRVWGVVSNMKRK